jgi:hypothetical protein
VGIAMPCVHPLLDMVPSSVQEGKSTKSIRSLAEPMGRFLHEHFLLLAAFSRCARTCLLLPYHLHFQYRDLVERDSIVPEGCNGVCWSKSCSEALISLPLTYLQPVILALFYIGLKIRNRRLWVRLHPIFNGPLGLSRVLNRLERNAQLETSTDEVGLQELDDIDGGPPNVRVEDVGR